MQEHKLLLVFNFFRISWTHHAIPTVSSYLWRGIQILIEHLTCAFEKHFSWYLGRYNF